MLVLVWLLSKVIVDPALLFLDIFGLVLFCLLVIGWSLRSEHHVRIQNRKQEVAVKNFSSCPSLGYGEEKFSEDPIDLCLLVTGWNHVT